MDFDGAAALTAVAGMPPDQPLGEALFLGRVCTQVCRAAQRLVSWLSQG